jgi:hypothetical protein
MAAGRTPVKWEGESWGNGGGACGAGQRAVPASLPDALPANPERKPPLPSPARAADCLQCRLLANDNAFHLAGPGHGHCPGQLECRTRHRLRCPALGPACAQCLRHLAIS